MALALRRFRPQAPTVDTNSLYEEGQFLMNCERWFTAESRFRQVLAINPRHGLARAHRAICLFNMSREGEAAKEAAISLIASPREAYTHFAFGVIQHARGKLGQARKSVATAVRRDPQNHSYQSRLAKIETAIILAKQR